MKKMINKNVKRSVIPIASILIIVISFLFYNEFTTPRYLETKVKTFTYGSNGNISYKVFLKPNILYTSPSLDEGGIYLTEFVDSVLADFKYDFTSERATDIKGEYEIIAVVEGYQEAKKDYIEDKEIAADNSEQKEASAKVIWGKEYKLIPETQIDVNDKAFSIVKNISLNYAEYNSFASKVIELSKLNIATRLSVIMNVNLQANTDKGLIEDKVSQSIIIPLGTSSFNIIKNEALEKPGAIEEVRKVQLPMNRMLLIAYGAAAGVSIIILAFLIFFTKTKPGISEHTKILNNIFKKYGNRLVALNSSSTCESDLCRMVRSIEDLVRIAEEIQKPVLYSYQPDSNFISRFFVYDDIWMYVFDIREYIRANKEEKTGTKPSGTSMHHPAGDSDVKA